MALNLSAQPAKTPPPVKGSGGTTSPRGSATGSKSLGAMRQGVHAQREEAVNGVFQLASYACVITGQHADAGAISLHGPNIARELASLADQNEQIAKGIDWLNKSGPYAGLIIAVMPFTLQVMANHKLLKAEHLAAVGVKDPELLANQIRADIARQRQEALMAAQLAEAQLAEAQGAMAAANGLAKENVPA